MSYPPPRPLLPSASSPADRMAAVRGWLSGTWTGWLLVAGLALKAVAYGGGFLGSAEAGALGRVDHAANLALAVVVGSVAWRVWQVARGRLLWRVRSRLVLSYVLIGVVPILLLGTFVAVGVLLLFFNISSYLVQNRLDGLCDQAGMLARTTLVEIQRDRTGNWEDLLDRHREAIAERYPDVALALLPSDGRARCGAPARGGPPPAGAMRPYHAGTWTLVEPPSSLPAWVTCEGFSGIVVSSAPNGGPGHLIARAVALSARSAFAVLVDLPVDQTLAASLRRDAGVELRRVNVIGDSNQAAPMRGRVETTVPATAAGESGALSTVTFITYTDWERGSAGSLALSMGVRVPALYAWLTRAQGTVGNRSFGRILMYVLMALGAMLLVIELAALAMGLALARSITGSVHALFTGTRRVRDGDLTHRIAVRSHDQLSELADSFNEMTASITGLLREAAEKKRLEEELRIAREIQMSLLPAGPLRMPGLSVTALCLPAREVGGDYYDFLPLDDHRVGVLIADVSGKGTSAAFYMAELKGLMISLSEIHSSPRQLLIEANRLIADHLDSRSFITMIYAIVDTRARTMTCARAGHTPFVYVPAADGNGRQAQVLTPDGMVLGLKLDGGERFTSVLQELTIPLCTGDLFVFFTDGISEAMNADDDCFGEDRLSSFVQARASLPPESLREEILREVEQFVGGAPQHDDMTLIVMRVEAQAVLMAAPRES
jgi:phosphoserine phosphatase RsbU/P